jgi:hypothetical protein
MDMKNSTAAAERLGEVDFHQLLNRLATDFSADRAVHSSSSSTVLPASRMRQ